MNYSVFKFHNDYSIFLSKFCTVVANRQYQINYFKYNIIDNLLYVSSILDKNRINLSNKRVVRIRFKPIKK